MKQSPLQYYAYVAFPIYFWKTVFQESNTLFCHINAKSFWNIFVKILAYILGLELLVCSYFDRRLLSYALVAFSILVPIFLDSKVRAKNNMLVGYWSLSCIATSVFPFLPVEQEENITLVSAGAILIAISGALFLINLPETAKKSENSFFERVLIKLQVRFTGFQL